MSRAAVADPRVLFLHYLQQLAGMVKRAIAHGESSGDGPEALMDARLAPDMFPFSQQVSTAAGFAVRALGPFADAEMPDLGQAQGSAELLALISRASSIVAEFPPNSLQSFEGRKINTTAGFSEHCFSGWEYLYLYAMPNFLFHMSMTYGILRSSGVALSKADFDGYHQYPPGFSFPSA